jgi:hypothetical protein
LTIKGTGEDDSYGMLIDDILVFGEVEEVNIIPLDKLLTDISNGEKVTSIAVKAALKEYYSNFDKDVNIAITLQLTPIFHLLNNNYDYYKDTIIDIFENKDNHKLLRLPMLEIIGYHLDDKKSLDSVTKIFLDKDNESSLILGKSARILSKNNINISKELMDRYPTSDGMLKLDYANILALLKPNISRDMIEKDMDSEIDGNNKIKLIIAFSRTGINDDYVVNKLMDMLYNIIPNSHLHPIEQEIIQLGLVMRLSESNRDDRFIKLIDIASNSKFDFDTRLVALQELSFDLPTNTTIDKNEMKIRLKQLSKDILSSPSSFKDKRYQDILNNKVINTLGGF